MMKNIKRIILLILMVMIFISCTSVRAGAGAGVNVGLTFDKKHPVKVTPYVGAGAGIFKFF
ncbi:MAG: hypothetical protein MR673_02255 [Fusobacterium perfoetens]|uniref:hypothetical protein n=1 Tax=Fusobacterium perfoetens TaxID=852 RepID=UPI0023F4D00C|nr:hypothetical protein [Fusobacterium perfoetens]MCI6151934.1 hypothetical protein [Fusobacterium perfoetens]MDY3238274.1 hypothetical protein [Fusobacterium perfoetens]